MLKLALKNILFALLLPGTVTVWLPCTILRGTHLPGPSQWTSWNLLGFAPMALGAAILFKCIWDFAVAGRGTLAPVDPPKRLVVRGLYRYVRNPMYVAVMTILLGETLLFSSFELLKYIGIIFLILNIFVFTYEEPVLRRKFGDSYEAYRRRVNRWLPRPPRATGR